MLVSNVGAAASVCAAGRGDEGVSICPNEMITPCRERDYLRKIGGNSFGEMTPILVAHNIGALILIFASIRIY